MSGNFRLNGGGTRKMNKFSAERKQWLIILCLCVSVAALYWRTLDYPPGGLG